MEQFERLELLIGKDNMDKLSSKTILILGVGGVGGYIVEALVRSGINNLIIVDSDTIDITNLNRQIITNLSNIGKLKVEEAKNRIISINEKCNVIAINKFIIKDNIDELFKYNIDYVIDACDTIETKKELIRICLLNNIKIISCMGTGNKLDPTKFKITDIRKTNYDPIAKKIRKMFKDENIKDKLPVLWSDEIPRKNNTGKIGTIAYMPSIAGLLCASYVINDIISK